MLTLGRFRRTRNRRAQETRIESDHQEPRVQIPPTQLFLALAMASRTRAPATVRLNGTLLRKLPDGSMARRISGIRLPHSSQPQRSIFVTMLPHWQPVLSEMPMEERICFSSVPGCSAGCGGPAGPRLSPHGDGVPAWRRHWGSVWQDSQSPRKRHLPEVMAGFTGW